LTHSERQDRQKIERSGFLGAKFIVIVSNVFSLVNLEKNHQLAALSLLKLYLRKYETKIS